jgi:hypothetical protein
MCNTRAQRKGALASNGISGAEPRGKMALLLIAAIAR